jgi:lipoic acid synthetase
LLALSGRIYPPVNLRMCLIQKAAAGVLEDCHDALTKPVRTDRYRAVTQRQNPRVIEQQVDNGDEADKPDSRIIKRELGGSEVGTGHKKGLSKEKCNRMFKVGELTGNCTTKRLRVQPPSGYLRQASTLTPPVARDILTVVSSIETPTPTGAASVEAPRATVQRRIPEWLTIKVPRSKDIGAVEDLMRGERLVTVCEEARCPNLGECWSKGTATFMIMGDTCTRSCRFCAVKTGRGLPLDPDEPRRLALAAKQLNLKHVVVTSVNRDELPDGGSNHFAEVIRQLRQELPNSTVEVLTPDFRGRRFAIETVCEAHPDVFNHNTETVPRLYRTVRPQAKYARSLDFLRTVKEIDPSIYTKSGIMLGLGETEDEVIEVLRDWKDAGVDAVTLGQYLKPGKGYLDVVEYLHPTRFDRYKEIAEEIGFLYVASGPFVRSSYNAIDFSNKFLRGSEDAPEGERRERVRPALPGLRRLELPLAVQ